MYNRYGIGGTEGIYAGKTSAIKLHKLPTVQDRYATTARNYILLRYQLTNMGIAFDYARDRPANIDVILNGLDRYNPETTSTFQDYVTQQCEDKIYDCYANLALLKL